MSPNSYLKADWPAPENVKAYTTTRLDGFSKASFAQFNLATHVDDELEAVKKNRTKLLTDLNLQQQPYWLNQVHGTQVVDLSQSPFTPTADASFCSLPHHACVILTADCLPILLCDINGQEVGAVHAGWRGLLNGVIDATINAMQTPAKKLLAWLGPAIGPDKFEINQQIKDDFITRHPAFEPAFWHKSRSSVLANLYQLASINLQQLGVTQIYGANHCVYTEDTLFYSYRRDQKKTGRMASLIWIE